MLLHHHHPSPACTWIYLHHHHHRHPPPLPVVAVVTVKVADAWGARDHQICDALNVQTEKKWVMITRRSEIDNTPQPLGQWMNCPLIGQQDGNCKNFTMTHYLADLFAMHCGPRSIPLCIQHHIQLTSLSFQVSRPYHCWDTVISIFYLENPRSRSYQLKPLWFDVDEPLHSYI